MASGPRKRDGRPRAKLVAYKNRPIGIRWRVGNLRGEKSAETMDREEAIGARALLLRDLAEGKIPGREKQGPGITWEAFVERYKDEHVSTLSEGSQSAWTTSSNHLKRLLAPKALADVDKGLLSEFRGKLLKEGKRPASVATYLRTLRAALGWAEDMDLIKRAPRVRTRGAMRTASGMRSRPITAEEFDRILEKVPIVRKRDADDWTHFLRGLWLSSLRLDELRRLSWDAGASLSIDQSGKYPMIKMLAEGHKSRRDWYQPMTPDFWALISAPGRSRTGYVFPLRGRGQQMTRKAVGRVIADIGKKARVITNAETKKTATSHDIGRRACITRVSTTLSMSQTQQFARHADPNTTSQYYLQHDASALAEALGWS